MFNDLIKLLLKLFYYNFFIYIHYFYLENYSNPIKKQKKIFKKKVSRQLDLNNPIFFNDKLQWLKFNWKDPLATKCADKYEVREYIKEKIGEVYLNELIEVYNSANEVNIDKLPKSFVLKGTHGSGMNIICLDKKNHDWKFEKNRMLNWYKIKYYIKNNEWVYKNIKPRIVAEKFLTNDLKSDINDYKFFCFHGIPKFLYISYKKYDHYGQMTKTRKYYTLDWKEIDIDQNGKVVFNNANSPKPHFIDEMIDLSKILSNPFPHVRVDFYFENQKIYFGELTFFHQSGMEIFPSINFEMWISQFLDLKKVS